MNKKLLGFVGGAVVIISILTYVFVFQSDNGINDLPEEELIVEEAVPEVEPEYRYGLSLDEYEIVEGQVKRNQTFAEILEGYNLSLQDIYTIDKISSDVFSVRNFIPNKNYTIFYKTDSLKRAAYLVYEPNQTEYIKYQLQDSLAVYRETREVEIVERTMAGVITQSLDHSIRQEGGTPALVNAMADLYGWQMDMRSLHPGDWFKIVYEDKLVNGESIGVGNILGAEFNHLKNSYMAYAFDKGDGLNYYDEKGESMQKAFLRYPVEYSRISSRYNPRRFHPVLKRRTPHLGTDYAANKGTPIKAAGDGVITARGYTRGNGNYVKIKHNGTYTTGYLHMSRFGKFKQGQRVKKGDVIGYVGKTGLATGYHLCFRFWKRGKQVDFLKEKLPAQEPLADEYMIRFESAMSLTQKKLADISMPFADQTYSASSN